MMRTLWGRRRAGARRSASGRQEIAEAAPSRLTALAPVADDLGSRRPFTPTSALLTVAVAVAGGLAAPGLSSAATLPVSDVTLDAVQRPARGSRSRSGSTRFTAATGIRVEMRPGSDFELANQHRRGGRRVARRVFLTENSPAMNLVERPACSFRSTRPARPGAGRVRPVGRQLGRASPPAPPFSSTTRRSSPRPSSRRRSSTSQGPSAGQLGRRRRRRLPGHRQRAPALRRATRPPRLAGRAMKRQRRVYRGNGAAMLAVNAGEVPAGVIYHYYWYGDQAGTGENSRTRSCTSSATRIPARSSACPAAACSPARHHADDAQRFLAFITSPEGQPSSPTAPRSSTRSAPASGQPGSEADQRTDPPCTRPLQPQRPPAPSSSCPRPDCSTSTVVPAAAVPTDPEGRAAAGGDQNEATVRRAGTVAATHRRRVDRPGRPSVPPSPSPSRSPSAPTRRLPLGDLASASCC